MEEDCSTPLRPEGAILQVSAHTGAPLFEASAKSLEVSSPVLEDTRVTLRGFNGKGRIEKCEPFNTLATTPAR